jgi:poly(A) polymerase
MLKKFIDKFLPKAKTRVKRVELGPEAHRIDPERVDRSASRVVATLREAGYDGWIVGGAVRDLMLGLTPKDFDVATNATPEQVKPLFRRAFVIGRRFKIAHVMMGNDTIEVTTYRGAAVNAAPTDEHGRVLSDNTYGTIEQDAVRRDFTVNALYYDPVSQVVVDFVGGHKDVATKTLKLIGDPETRYREDPVRMLRAVRLASKLGMKIAPTTKKPIALLADLITNVPAARLFDEIQKLLLSGHAVETVKQLRENGLHKGLLPLLDVITEQPKGKAFVDAALTITDERVAAGKSVSPAYLFAALLWHELLKAWEVEKKKGEHSIPALQNAMDSVIETQCENMAIPRRYTTITREIWSMQPRFEQRTNAAAERFLGQERFRAAYDFMLLRSQCGEVDPKIAVWWTDFQEVEGHDRERMIREERERLRNAGEVVPTKKKRRRGGKAKARAAGDAVPVGE